MLQHNKLLPVNDHSLKFFDKYIIIITEHNKKKIFIDIIFYFPYNSIKRIENKNIFTSKRNSR